MKKTKTERDKKGDSRVMVAGHKKKKKKALEAAGIKLNNNSLKFRLVKDQKLAKELCSLETQQVEFVTNYKFGVLFCLPGQSENQMFNNVQGPHCADFDEFLNFIGDRITLEKWTDFRGGLDVKNNTTGRESIFTKFHNCNIMFHVSTLLPYTEGDEQQVERKRHIGNDVLLIIFKEGDTPFYPNLITSNFNNIIVVVSKLTSEDSRTFYRIAFAEKHNEGSAAPHLPEIPIFPRDEHFREFLLMKLINSERTVMKSREFRNKLSRARLDQLRILVNQFKD
eukprot:TRINITY_DN1809_c0_g1_i2.p1 TRINITY_DN1809_c0_g1~~TRINITY_DN1809_c0_g1_i2.p1  ORF type:complete len:281 (-),score=57.38 TRINITY_DN1809_c0_g1_i2:114-956(-)